MRDNDREEYEKFFENFGRGLEFGIYNSYGMLKDQLADLLLFYSAKQEKLVTLDEYLEAAPADRRPSTTPPARASSAWPRCPS